MKRSGRPSLSTSPTVTPACSPRSWQRFPRPRSHPRTCRRPYCGTVGRRYGAVRVGRERTTLKGIDVEPAVAVVVQQCHPAAERDGHLTDHGLAVSERELHARGFGVIDEPRLIFGRLCGRDMAHLGRSRGGRNIPRVGIVEPIATGDVADVSNLEQAARASVLRGSACSARVYQVLASNWRPIASASRPRASRSDAPATASVPVIRWLYASRARSTSPLAARNAAARPLSPALVASAVRRFNTSGFRGSSVSQASKARRSAAASSPALGEPGAPGEPIDRCQPLRANHLKGPAGHIGPVGDAGPVEPGGPDRFVRRWVGATLQPGLSQVKPLGPNGDRARPSQTRSSVGSSRSPISRAC